MVFLEPLLLVLTSAGVALRKQWDIFSRQAHFFFSSLFFFLQLHELSERHACIRLNSCNSLVKLILLHLHDNIAGIQES